MTAATTAGIEFVGVTKRFGAASGATGAVDNVSFAVPAGTLTTILGPSGCGKTTLLRMIAGLEQPSSGRILVHGKDVTLLAPAQRNVSLVFQSYALFPHMSVLDNVAYGLTVSGLAKAEVRHRAMAGLASVGLEGLGERWPSELSGGQQQRVAVARALVLEPAVLLFDEPLSNLDARLRRSMRDEIRSLQQRLALTVAYVTHDQHEALAVSDQIIVMNQGRIAQVGAPRELYEQPVDAFVAGFMGEAMLLPATCAADGTVAIGPLQLRPAKAPEPGPVQVALRPEAWRIGDAGGGGLPGQIAKAAYLGAVCEYTIATELGELFVVADDVSRLRAVGERVTLSLGERGVAVLGR